MWLFTFICYSRNRLLMCVYIPNSSRIVKTLSQQYDAGNSLYKKYFQHIRLVKIIYIYNNNLNFKYTINNSEMNKNNFE